MRSLVAVIAAVFFSLSATLSAQARVVINVDKSQQRMTVVVDGVARYAWDVSTGRASFGTPSGVYTPQRLERSWFSRKYYDAPMPYSIFFHRGYAIHGSYEISRLGGPASHGCIRLHPRHAAILFALVRSAGPSATTIVVSGETMTARRRRPAREARYRAPPEAGFAPPTMRRVYRAPPPFADAADPYEDDGGWVSWGGSRR